ncbi:MAG: aldo/keto reductase [Bacteroidales bacterium]|nr:aldo/keto reductase [Bacteroidales bacterium]
MNDNQERRNAFPPIGIGTYSLKNEELQHILESSVNLGYQLIDTAYKYRNEFAIGQVLRDIQIERSRVWLETKAGPELILGRKRFLRLDKKSVGKVLNEACHRLCTDYIDVFLLHCVFAGYKDSFCELLEYKKMGQVRFVGVCNISLEQLENLYEDVGIYPDVVQVEIHPYYTNLRLRKYCQEHGIMVEARSPFAHGDAWESWLREPVLVKLKEKYQVSIPQLILRWLSQNNIIALPRTVNYGHLKENLRSLEFNISEEDMSLIESLNRNQSYGFISSKNRKRCK